MFILPLTDQRTSLAIVLFCFMFGCLTLSTLVHRPFPFVSYLRLFFMWVVMSIALFLFFDHLLLQVDNINRFFSFCGHLGLYT